MRDAKEILNCLSVRLLCFAIELLVLFTLTKFLLTPSTTCSLSKIISPPFLQHKSWMYNIMCHPGSNHWCHGKLWQGIDDSTLCGFYACWLYDFWKYWKRKCQEGSLSWFLFLLIFLLSITWLFWRNKLPWIIYCVGFWFWLPFDTYGASATVLCMMKNL